MVLTQGLCHPQVQGSLGGFTGPTHHMTQCYDLLQQKDVRQNQQREKGHGVNSVGNQAQVSQSPLPMESHSTGFVPPASHSATCGEVLSTREAS